MGDITQLRDIGELIDVKALSAPLSWTAGSGTDSATFTGIAFDRGGFAGGSLPQTMDIDIAFGATLGSGQTLSVQWDLQDSADDTNFSDFMTEASTVIATGPSGGGTVNGVARMTVPSASKPAGTPGVDVRGARRYGRLLLIPHLSRTGTDIATIQAVGVFAGFDLVPAPVN